MAKVIRATPTLTGEEAMAFIRKMRKMDNVMPSRTDTELLQIVKTHQKQFRV